MEELIMKKGNKIITIKTSHLGKLNQMVSEADEILTENNKPPVVFRAMMPPPRPSDFINKNKEE